MYTHKICLGLWYSYGAVLVMFLIALEVVSTVAHTVDQAASGRWAQAQNPGRGVQVEGPKEECPAEENLALAKALPVYIHWHWLRHAQWHEDEVIDIILEAMAKEEEGQEGTAKGRGPVFQLLLAILEAAGPAKAELVRSGIPASVALESLRTGAAGRAREVKRLAAQFTPHLGCLRTYRKTIEYLAELNQMPYFPDPIVDPAGEIGRFIGAYMRKHVIVDHDVITQGILIAALNAHKVITPSAKQSATRAGSLLLLEKALEKLDPKTLVMVRQYQSDKALKAFLEARVELKKRQAKAVQEYEASYKMLSTALQEACVALAPPSVVEQRPAARAQPLLDQASEAPRAVDEVGTPPVSRPKAPVVRNESASTEKRIALVIGNGGYTDAPLHNPLNDARAMEKSLREVGFDVLKRENLPKRDLEDAIRAFGKRLRGGGVGLFYFAGHGVQVNGSNYLLPIGSTIEKEQDVEYEAVEAGRVISEMEAAGNRLNIMILDACRNNPFARSFRAATRGLAPMHAPSGTVIAYATAPGTVSRDGDGANGLCTQALLEHMGIPGMKLEDVFKRVRVAVKEKSRGRQLPWESSSLEGDFYFVPTATR